MEEIVLDSLMMSLGSNRFSGIIIPRREYYLDKLLSLIEEKIKGTGVEFNRSSMYYKFPNGSRIAIFTSESPERLRGMLMDYVGFIDFDKMEDSDYLEKSIVRPSIYSTNGRIVKKEDVSNG